MTKKSKAELMRERFSEGKIKNNDTKVILEDALKEKEQESEKREETRSSIKTNGSPEIKKRGRKVTVNPEEKRDITIAFKTSRTRLKRLEKILDIINESKKEDFGISKLGMSELVDSLLFSHPKIQKMLGETEEKIINNK